MHHPILPCERPEPIPSIHAMRPPRARLAPRGGGGRGDVKIVERRVLTKPGLHTQHRYVLFACYESRLTARPCARVESVGVPRPPTVVGTSPTGLSGATRGCRRRARRRAVGPRRCMCFVPVHVRPMVPRDRSPAALGGVGTVSQILLMLSISRVGKGLMGVRNC